MKTIILIEGEKDTQIILDSKSSNAIKIISFDYNTTQLLKKMKIDNLPIDNYFKKSDSQLIDELVVNFTQNWYHQCNENNELDFKEVNIGYLIEAEILRYFLLTLRRIVAIIRIIEKENPEKIICGTLGKFVKNLCNNLDVIIETNNQEIDSELEFSKIEIPFNMGFKRNFTISRKNYLKIKNLFEGCFTRLLNTKFNLDEINKKETILLLDFNPIFYSTLLEELDKRFPNLILLNQRRPAIWNKESFRIIKKTNSKIIRLEDFETLKVKSIIKNHQEEQIKKLKLLFSNKQLFQNYFKVEEYSFWEIIQDNFKNMIISRTKEIIRKYILSEEVFEKVSISGILEWAHTGFEERIVLSNSKKKNIPVVFIQHAQNLSNNKYDKFIPFQPILPTNNSKTAVWGNISKQFLITKGITESDILVAGSPKHDELFVNKNYNSDSGIILLALSGSFSSYNFHGNEIRALENLENIISTTIKTIKGFSSKKLIVKLHPSKSYIDIKSIVHQIDSQIPVFQDGNPMSLLKSCDALIVNDISTIMLEAMILNKPTMCINTQNQNIQEELVIKNDASFFVSNIQDLDKSIKQFLSDESLRNNLIEKGNIFVNDYFSNRGNASKYLADILFNQFHIKKSNEEINSK